MPYNFTPPGRTETVMIRGSLRYSYPVTYTVYHVAGVWHAVETPAFETLQTADIVLAGRPQVVDDVTAASLISAGVGTCIPV